MERQSALRRTRAKEPEDKRTYRIPVYVSQEELDRISEAAERAGLSTSNYCRIRLLKGVDRPQIAV